MICSFLNVVKNVNNSLKYDFFEYYTFICVITIIIINLSLLCIFLFFVCKNLIVMPYINFKKILKIKFNRVEFNFLNFKFNESNGSFLSTVNVFC